MRLFVGLDLPWELRDRLVALSGRGIPGARWVPAENYHLTLRFIGETPAYLAEEIDLALAALKARGFALTLAGLGTFSKGGRATALWVGVERSRRWSTCARRSKRRCSGSGWSRSGGGFLRTSRWRGWTGRRRRSWRRSWRSTTVPRPFGAGGAFHAVQLAAWQGAGGLYAGGGVPARFGGVRARLTIQTFRFERFKIPGDARRAHDGRHRDEIGGKPSTYLPVLISGADEMAAVSQLTGGSYNVPGTGKLNGRGEPCRRRCSVARIPQTTCHSLVTISLIPVYCARPRDAMRFSASTSPAHRLFVPVMRLFQMRLRSLTPWRARKSGFR